MVPFDLSQLGSAASGFATSLASAITISQFVRSLLRTYPSPKQLYLDICEEFMELRWVRTLVDSDFDCLLRFLSLEEVGKQWGSFIGQGKLNRDSMGETFLLVGGNPALFDVLVNSLIDLTIRKLQSVLPKEFSMLSVIVVTQGEELKQEIKELRDGLLQLSQSKASPAVTMVDLSAADLEHYLVTLKTRFYQRWSIFVDMLGKRIQNDIIPSKIRHFLEPEIHMVLNEFYKKRSLDEHRIPVNISRAVFETDKMVLLGEPGSGKTTVLEKLAYEFASEALVCGGRTNNIPIYINLGSFGTNGVKLVRKKSDSFYHFLIHETAQYLPAVTFDNLLKKGNFVFLLDGLNEMPRNNYIKQCNDIRQFVDNYNNNKFVIACREADYLDIFRMCEKLIILPLSDSQIQKFTRMYLGKQRQFLKQLKESPSRFYDLARNPYMLMVMLAISAYRGSLPESRAKMLKVFIESLLEKARLRGKVFDVQDTYSQLSNLASFMADEGLLGSTVDVKWLRTKWPKRAGSLSVKSIDRLLDIASTAGILIMPPEERTLQFNHQLLQEYLAVTVLYDDLFQEGAWRLPESRDKLGKLSSIQYTKNQLPYHSKEVQILRLLASFVTVKEALLLLNELVETNIFLARAIGREMEPSIAHEVFDHLLRIAEKPSSTFEEWLKVVRMLRLIEGPYAIEALVNLSLDLASMSSVDPYLKQAVARAIKYIEMGYEHDRSLEIT